MGRRAVAIPARLRRMASETAHTASSCPTMRLCRRPMYRHKK
jgi:hypothetical protein